MAHEPKTVVVNGQEYIISRFMADVGLKVFMRLAKIAAEPLTKAMAVKDLNPDAPEFADAIGGMVESIASKLDENEVIRTVEELLSVVVPLGVQTTPLGDPLNPGRGTWKVHFTGNLGDLFVVLIESVKENFSDFLFALKRVAPSVAAAAARTSRGPNT